MRLASAQLKWLKNEHYELIEWSVDRFIVKEEGVYTLPDYIELTEEIWVDTDYGNSLVYVVEFNGYYYTRVDRLPED